MKRISRIGRSTSLDTGQPSQMRRKLLMGCAYLPAAPLLAMLGGCDETSPEAVTPTTFGDIFDEPPVVPEAPPVVVAPETPGLKIPLPPYKTTDDTPPPPAPQVNPATTVPVTHIPKQTQTTSDPAPVQPEAVVKPPPPKPTRMIVGIYSLQYNSFKQVSARRSVPVGTPGASTIVIPGTGAPEKISFGKPPQKSLFDDAVKPLIGQDARMRLDEFFEGFSTKDFNPAALKEAIGQDAYKKFLEAGYYTEVITPAVPDKVKEGIESYLKRALDNRFALLYRALVSGLAALSHPAEGSQFDVVFFTAPEFYWNVPFGDFLTEAELQIAANLCLNTVTRHVKTLMSKFPADKYGKIVLLPGTIAMLKPNPDALKPDLTLAGDKGIIYEAFNQVVCTHNLPLDDAKKRPAYMIWPKRVVSHIDYFDELHGQNCGSPDKGVLLPNPLDPDLEHGKLPGTKNPIFECVLSKQGGLKVKIGYVTSSIGSSFDAKDKLLSNKFQNNIIEGLPFGVDICLDYSVASIQKDEHRMAQLDERNFKLDFLLAAGMYLNINNYANTPHIQYAIRNEGMDATEVWDLNWTKGTGIGNDLGSMSYDNLLPFGAMFIYDDAGEIVKDWLGNPIIDDTISYIPVDKTSTYKAPQDVDSKDIPNILDAMNNANVRIWKLDVDVSDTAPGANTLVASKLTRMPQKAAIQFIK